METAGPSQKRTNHLAKFIRALMVIIIAGLYLVILVGSIYEAVVFPHTPQRVTLAQAVAMDQRNQPDFLVFDKTLYISITDENWQCASIKQSGYKSISTDKRRTDAVFTDASMSAVVFTQVDGFYSCQELRELKLSGELQRVETRPVQYESDTTGITIIDENSSVPVYYFSTHRTPFSAISLPIFLLLMPFILRRMYRKWKTA